MARYRNPGIQHRTIQIAMDGSQKLPQRILATMADNLDAGRPVARLGLVVAAWIRFLRGVSDSGAVIEVSDPLAGPLQAAARGGDPVGAVLAVSDVFAGPLVAMPGFRAAVQDGHDRLAAHGVAQVLRGWDAA